MATNFIAQLPPTNHAPRSRGRHNARFAAELRANPGQWAEYPHRNNGHRAAIDAAGRINRGATAAFGKGFEAEVRDSRIYVRYVGETS